MAEKIITVEKAEELSALFGNFDENISILQKQYNVTILGRGSSVKISGADDDADMAERAIKALLLLVSEGDTLTEQTIRYIFEMTRDAPAGLSAEQLSDIKGKGICISALGKPIRPKTLGQKQYVKAMEDNTIVFGVGPAGTGKTYLAVAMAVKAFKAHEITKIILTRPAVEAGEKLGFLPGDMQEKVDPYLRPLYDALVCMLGADVYSKHMEKGNIEVAPLAYMRGRTLDDAFIILDEAQNTTQEQMKMFLTRLGFNSRMVVTGDITQIDLPDKRRSGLIEAIKVLQDVEDIGIVKFTDKDVVRHKLVQQIIRAYNNYDTNT